MHLIASIPNRPWEHESNNQAYSMDFYQSYWESALGALKLYGITSLSWNFIFEAKFIILTRQLHLIKCNRILPITLPILYMSQDGKMLEPHYYQTQRKGHANHDLEWHFERWFADIEYILNWGHLACWIEERFICGIYHGHVYRVPHHRDHETLQYAAYCGMI